MLKRRCADCESSPPIFRAPVGVSKGKVDGCPLPILHYVTSFRGALKARDRNLKRRTPAFGRSRPEIPGLTLCAIRNDFLLQHPTAPVITDAAIAFVKC